MIPWFSFVSMGTTWRVVRGTHLNSPLSEGEEGVTKPEASLIVVNAALSFSRACVVAVHEMLHAVVSTPGEIVLLARLLGCSEDDAVDREEDVVTLWGPKLADTLIRNSLLTLPPF